MSIRKIEREKLRRKAMRVKAKPSAYVHYHFAREQVEKYGAIGRKIHVAISTHPRRLWRSRIQDILG